VTSVWLTFALHGQKYDEPGLYSNRETDVQFDVNDSKKEGSSKSIVGVALGVNW
jgi:hypothetical protein